MDGILNLCYRFAIQSSDYLSLLLLISFHLLFYYLFTQALMNSASKVVF